MQIAHAISIYQLLIVNILSTSYFGDVRQLGEDGKFRIERYDGKDFRISMSAQGLKWRQKKYKIINFFKGRYLEQGQRQ